MGDANSSAGSMHEKGMVLDETGVFFNTDCEVDTKRVLPKKIKGRKRLKNRKAPDTELEDMYNIDSSTVASESSNDSSEDFGSKKFRLEESLREEAIAGSNMIKVTNDEFPPLVGSSLPFPLVTDKKERPPNSNSEGPISSCTEHSGDRKL